MGVAPVLIYFALGFSMKQTIHFGYPHGYGNPTKKKKKKKKHDVTWICPGPTWYFCRHVCTAKVVTSQGCWAIGKPKREKTEIDWEIHED